MLIHCRASLYDQQILDWVKRDIIKGELIDEDADMAELSRRLVNRFVSVSHLHKLPCIL